MKKGWITLLAVALTGCVPASVPAPSDEQAVEQLVDRYLTSINTCDTTVVSEIWSHDGDASFVAPSGYYPSYEAIRDSLVVGLFGKNFTQRNLRKLNLKLRLFDNSAWGEFSWKFDAIRLDGSEHHTRGMETQIYKKDSNGKWRLVHVHYSTQ